jgi:hypothetical protein
MKEQESDMTSLNFNMRKSDVWCPPIVSIQRGPVVVLVVGDG